MIAKYGWSSDDIIFYETFISITPTVGSLIGRVIGTPLVNKGRFLCIIIGTIVMLFGISFMLILNIYSFLAGRLIYAVGAGIFFTSSPRYIEECSPPHLFTIMFTIYAFGVALNRPVLVAAALMIP
jgi:MFS family permease